MELEVKRPEHIVPSYSLTGDLISYLRCRLRYRYENGSALPPSRPVQQWYGEFLHGTLELSFRFWASGGNSFAFPWPITPREWGQDEPQWQENDIGRFAHTVETALRQQGKQARSTDARNSAYVRVGIAINELGPHLFPLIAAAERKVIGTRAVPLSTETLRCSNYEVHGVIDVLTNLTLGQADSSNLIRRSVSENCPTLAGEYEVIVDYKGSQRPLINEAYWEQGAWQVQTYAWLRSRQPDALPVAAGILLYVNELTPGHKEMENIRRGITEGTTDVMPQPNSSDAQLVRLWRAGMDAGQLSLEFRLRRAIRVIPVTPASTQLALDAFDGIVRSVEENIVAENGGSSILDAWSPDCRDEDTCSACDFRHFCPNPAWATTGYVPSTPTAP